MKILAKWRMSDLNGFLKQTRLQELTTKGIEMFLWDVWFSMKGVKRRHLVWVLNE